MVACLDDTLVVRFLVAFFFGAVFRDTALEPAFLASFFADVFLATCFLAISIPLIELGFRMAMPFHETHHR